MKEIHDWARWFRELASKILTAGEYGLIQQARQVDWVRKPALLKYGDQGIDPFSFFYSLAQKSTKNQRPRVYPSVAKCFGLKSPPDPSNVDFYFFPTPIATARVLFHNGQDFYPELLWKLFRQAVEHEPQIDPDTFRAVLKIPFVGLVKLTQTLLLINPDYFLPTDVLQHVPANEGIDPKRCDHDGYMSALRKARLTFPKCRPYEINIFVYLQFETEAPLLTAKSRFFQISTTVDKRDCWEDFDRSRAVYTDASGPGEPSDSWKQRTNGGDGRGAPHPLEEPKRGDIILVRTGFRGRAIGIVHRNDFAKPSGFNEQSRLHVYWINKASVSFLDLQTDQAAFSQIEPGSSTYKAFAKTAPYEPTFALIEKVRAPNPPSPPPPPTSPSVHPLNQILYGPPGTGKTWHTVTRAVAIIENRHVHEVEQVNRTAVKRRFDKYRNAGRIEMVTFHQNTTYEDFIEGIRPVLTSDGANASAEVASEQDVASNVRYELSRGVLIRIAERAEEDSTKCYVLVIDEINRGNIARIFGELITLIEGSKRIGRSDETRVTLPGSQRIFGVPANLYIVGTMNTADRSIALLDTALRRRFVFEEMMPNPSHPDLCTDVDGVNCGKLLDAMNRRIAVLLDREHQIGHTYFLRVDSLEVLARTFRTRIIPLLQEYFYDDWEKIQAVLNENEFVRKSPPPEELVRSDLVDSSRAVYELPAADDGRWTAPNAYRAIYETKTRG